MKIKPNFYNYVLSSFRNNSVHSSTIVFPIIFKNGFRQKNQPSSPISQPNYEPCFSRADFVQDDDLALPHFDAAENWEEQLQQCTMDWKSFATTIHQYCISLKTHWNNTQHYTTLHYTTIIFSERTFAEKHKDEEKDKDKDKDKE